MKPSISDVTRNWQDRRLVGLGAIAKSSMVSSISDLGGSFAAHSDSTFFATHSVQQRVRPYIPGEFGRLDRHIDQAITDSFERETQSAMFQPPSITHS